MHYEHYVVADLAYLFHVIVWRCFPNTQGVALYLTNKCQIIEDDRIHLCISKSGMRNLVSNS